MLDEGHLKKLAGLALDQAKGYETELIISAGESALTRWGDNRITQNVSQGGAGVSVRLWKDGKMGKASTGNLTEEGIARCVQTAQAVQSVAEPEEGLLPLPTPQTYTPKSNYFKGTHDFTPEQRADGIKLAADKFAAKGLTGAGIFDSGASATAIANSKGLWAYQIKSRSSFSVSAMSADSSGWAEDGDSDVTQLDPNKISQIALDKALAGVAPADVDPGEWTVILEPAAVADATLFLSWVGFNGKAFVEGRSPFSGKVGQKVVGENITLIDDAWHELTPGQPFDYEGVPRKRVVLIENGVFKGTVHDRKTGPLAGCESTGHSLPQPDSNGPMPVNIAYSPGNSSIEEMIASTDKGLLVTRFHYTNLLDPMKMMITGMTRDGLFLVEKGKIVKGVKNMRFTESVLAILSNAAAISKQLYKTETFWGGGGTVAPAMKINDFHFTSRTEN